ncbi:tRNA 2-thiouridine(34) synthase MnmA [Candidatus Mycoplasma mahonii]|uniref:tRNA 2-thiouridine(34) synthase MnmA n=1 Tax=Candidatus Mycoplasma mahonii TaxID=3004105 RepID=UPI0026F047AB|nr:tRNA 2-thiouridine(34) synthase MnmA [Candidatus Mycoplasma mahonii]WKX02259.1 tRNA 2-thiouridine(34) synthase MnmA [Candidatus Mycoplasma mahonii]
MLKIVVGMSGGVDSAVTAYILKQQGHEVVGVFMRNWDSTANNDILGNPTQNKVICPEEQDWQDVVALGKQIGIKVQRVDFITEYWDDVFKDLIDQYKKGRTPNPDVLCNKYIKFGAFHDWVEKHIPNVDYIAMGHYADVKDGILSMPHDHWKDQTYFLSQVTHQQLKKVLFPLANLTKSEVRKIANDNHLVVANKKDSTGICFIGERDFAQFLQNYIPAQPGDIIDIITKKKIGEHIGVMYYTIGQRKGLNLGGMTEPYYVAGHDLSKKIIYAAPLSNKEYLLSDEALITDMNWVIKNYVPKNLMVKFRYKSDAVSATMTWNNDNVVLKYSEGFEAVTPGQQAVFYDGNKCLGGGIIDRVYKDGLMKEFL